MAITSDALVVGEDFISEHYFTTDAKSQSFHAKVLERRKQWDAAKAEGHSTVRARYTESRGKLTTEFIGLSESADEQTLDELYGTLRTVLGFDNALRWQTERIGGNETQPGPALAVHARDLGGSAPFVLVEACGGLELEDLLAKNEKTLLREFHTENDTIVSVAGLLSHLFVSEDGPKFALVLAGSTALVTERERWLEGRYLAVDLQLIGERNDDKRGGETDRALTCLEADSLAPDSEGDIWWTNVIDESVKHTVGVSKDLREGVRLSIEIIANDVVSRRREQGLVSLADDSAQLLAGQSLRFLYRILFLLYAEATPELSVVPAGDPTYERGYSLDRLRELLPVELVTPHAQSGTHFYDSLKTLFDLVDRGHDGGVDDNDDARAEGLTFRSLRADLFRPIATSLIDDVKLSNAALQKVLRHLLLSKEYRGKDRGFISYAELGINQLGAVYEGLMSYTGFFAQDTLYEVAKNGDDEKGSWVVPESRIEGIAESDFVRMPDEITGELAPVKHTPGTFVFRLAGRERQQSASYYTPEVLTRFTVGQALEELLDQNGTTTTAEEILEITVCEPALGSGAFAIEAVRQLAEQYLTRRQNELGERIEPDKYPTELQRVKAYLALHQVYGVDLNATAVEFAEISLWLDTMGPDLSAPWFGLHLRRGNSLIGARRAVIPGNRITDTGWIAATPVDVPLGESLDKHKGAVHHFLVPASGWGSTAEAKEGKALAPDATAELKEWRRGLKKKLTATQVRQLRGLAQRVETLWGFALRRLQIAESEIRRDIPVWGRDFTPTGGAVSREEIEESLADEAGAYRRLRRVMDAWCALWFWPLTETARRVGHIIAKPPSVDEWIETLTDLLGTPVKETRGESKFGQYNLFDVSDWTELGHAEETDLLLAQAKDPFTVAEEHPWLAVTDRVTLRQGFFHWELDFAQVFDRGGFDLQVGNPPWVRPDFNESAALAEFDVTWALESKIATDKARTMKTSALKNPSALDFYISELEDTVANRAFLSSPNMFPYLTGLRADLYRCFMEQTWRNNSNTGIVALIHLVTHLTDEKAGKLRRQVYERLRRHWQFINELKLFEIQDQKSYGVEVYGQPRDVRFLSASWLYHPETVIRSLSHDGSGPEPGLKDDTGKWDLRPHAKRIIQVDDTVLSMWKSTLESEAVPIRQTRMFSAVNESSSKTLAAISQTTRIGDLGLFFSQGWNETTDFKKGFFTKKWGAPQSLAETIIQGPHLYVGTPYYKSPNATMLHQQDWAATDLETLTPDALPITSYKPEDDQAHYSANYTSWSVAKNSRTETIRARDYFRIAWRAMAANTGERTLMAAIVPPGVAHVHGVASAALPFNSSEFLPSIAAVAASLLADFAVRTVPKSTISASTFGRLPWISDRRVQALLHCRSLRLNCVTDAYRELWNESFDNEMTIDGWAGGFEHQLRTPLGEVNPEWTPDTPLRIAADRRQALVEIDALVALGLGLTADELCTIYRTQFPVLYGYDRNKFLYDINGRLVPQKVLAVWRKKNDAISEEERTATNAAGNTYVYELPFQFLDREADMREAYAEFEKRLALKGDD
ncbi:class I SAM-dependent DNA methyltransferase [Rhodococcus sp. HNM0563]|uniref:class I SAM-dependent DNA methyltransferase n=1 Tax=Rhodococcus sp. HNM0563 TaxID=2716339 RepID=UPI00146D2D81|nr:class I SAM-dependent DNA methyltransferase [Rhodococcus sp. HNM0563]NLU64267.1 class I SAM-dependent DNA methyltransferase [Rhodococcus sp. HNM0563]